jgi:hypothetical protein
MTVSPLPNPILNGDESTLAAVSDLDVQVSNILAFLLIAQCQPVDAHLMGGYTFPASSS